MGRRKKQRAEPQLPIDAAKQLIKVATMVLRDHTPMSYHEASLALALCWRHTETEAQAIEREQRTGAD
jgi:hypothetical protein